MRDSIRPARLTRSRRAHLLAVALLLSVVLVAGCTGSSGSPGPASAGPATASGSAAAAGPATTVVAGSAPTSAVSSCPVQTIDQAPCYTPHQLLVAYGIQPLLDRGIDGRGETVTVLAPAPSSDASSGSAGTDIRQDLEAFNRMFGLPAARIQVVTTLAGSAAPWQASVEEVGDTEIVHAVAPAATLRVVLLPPGADLFENAATATADMIAGLRLAISRTDVASISWSLGNTTSRRLR